MYRREVAMKKVFSIIAAVVVASVLPVSGQSASDVDALIKAVSGAMGADRLHSIQYTGTGSMNPTGQAYASGGPWPRFTVTKYTMSIDFTQAAMRQELVRIDDARPPRGGGAGGYN